MNVFMIKLQILAGKKSVFLYAVAGSLQKRDHDSKTRGPLVEHEETKCTDCLLQKQNLPWDFGSHYQPQATS